MTFDELKEYTKEMIALAGDTTADQKTAIVMAVIQSKHVVMPSDLAPMERIPSAAGMGAAIRGAGGLLPRSDF